MNARLHARPRRAGIWRAGWALLILLAIAGRAAAQTPVDLQLVLAVDASGSVDQVRFELQKRGYVAAFRHARVLQAVRSGPNRAIAVTMVQWTGPMLQVQVVGWTLIGGEETAIAFSDAIERAPRQLFGGGTSISGAIDYAATLFAQSSFRANRRVAHAGKMLNEEIDYSVAKAPHFVFGKFETRRIRFIAHAWL